MVIQEMVKIHATWFCVIAKTIKEVESEYRNVVIKELKKNYEYFKHNKDVNSRR